MQINDPTTLAEMQAMFDRYEDALVNNHPAVLAALFWDDALTIRFGAAETLYGAGAIAAFRVGRPAGRRPRQILRTTITTYGAHFATALTEFVTDGETATGLQSQSWVRMPEGWRVVAAHVSYIK